MNKGKKSYSKVGQLIKIFSIIILIFGIVGIVILDVITLNSMTFDSASADVGEVIADASTYIPTLIVSNVIGIFGLIFSTLLLYGFGEIIDRITSIDEKLPID